MNGQRESVDLRAAGPIPGGTPPADPQDVTQLLADWSHGDHAALEKLTPLVYEKLHHLAHHYMEAQRPDHTLQTTALVNEAYVRFAGPNETKLYKSITLFGRCRKAMRQILVNHAKAAQRQKRGAGAAKVELDEAALISPEEPKVILDLHDALERLAALDCRKAQVVELSYFGGLKQQEIAEVLKISTITVRRDWVFAKAWLLTRNYMAQPEMTPEVTKG
jgi:RNA polymerase sigma factor (TIGR02999 family)